MIRVYNKFSLVFVIAISCLFFTGTNLFSQQKGVLLPDESSLVVDLTVVNSVAVRSEIFHFLESSKELRIVSFEHATKLTLASKSMSHNELQVYYEAVVQRFVENDKHRSKDEQSASLQAFATKYGYETADKLLGTLSVTDNNTCATSLPFCTDITYNFPAGTSGSGESGPNYGCLNSTPAPAWYHMKIAIGGSLTITMYSTPLVDIDFILWGPFDDPVSPCTAGLTANKIIDCSYSTAATEYCDLANGIVGKYYILLITNYSQQPCNITFHKTGGVGATDCTIVPPPIGSNSPVCVGETINLWADDFAGATYAWTGPNGWTSNQQNPTILNANMNHAGTYSLVITVNGSQSQPISTVVVVNATPIPAFTGENVCFGATTHFTNQSTTNPPGQTITSRLWSFGDGQTSNDISPTHVYATAGSFNVTLTCYTGMQNCAESVSHTVMVYANPVPAFTASAACFGEATVFTNQSTTNPPGQIISGYLWDFGDGNTSTVPNPTHTYSAPGTYPVTLTCYTGNNSCDETVNHNVTVNTIPVPAFSSEDVCYGSPTVFVNTSTTNPPGETISAFEWDFGDGQTSTEENPTHIYADPGTYLVTLTCFTGNEACDAAVSNNTIVSAFPEVYAGEDKNISNGWSTILDESTIEGGSGSLNFIWSPAEFLVDATVLHPTTVSLTQSKIFTLTVTDAITGCISDDDITVNVAGGPLYVAATATPEVICFGESTDLYAYTTGGAGAYTFTWTSNPAGFESNIQNPTVVPDITTTYFISVFDGQITVNSSITVVVKPVPTAVAGDDQTINMGTSTSLHGLYYGGSGNFSYLWSPADSLANPTTGQYEQNPLTKVMVDTANPTVFTLQILDNNGCNSEPDQMTVFVGGAMLSVFATTTEDVICRGESSTVSAAASGGAGTFTYLWSSQPAGTTSTNSQLDVTPEMTTTYFVSVSDGYFNVIDSVQIIVNQLPLVDLKPANINWYRPDTINVCVRDSVWLDAGPNMTYHWNNGSIDRKIRSITNGQWVDFQTYSVEVTNPATGCKNNDIITIFFDFNTCNLGIDDREDVSNKLKVTPNPTNGVFNLDLKTLNEDGTLYLIDASGKIISEEYFTKGTYPSGTKRFDISPLPQGMYLLYFRSEKYVAVKQLIKN